MKYTKRMLALLLAICMVFTSVQLPANAEEGIGVETAVDNTVVEETETEESEEDLVAEETETEESEEDLVAEETETEESEEDLAAEETETEESEEDSIVEEKVTEESATNKEIKAISAVKDSVSYAAANAAVTEKEVVDAAIVFSDLHTSNGNYKEETVRNIFTALKNTALPFSSVTSGGDAFSVNESSTTYNGYTKNISTVIRNVLGDSDIPISYVWSDHDRAAYQEADESKLLDKTSRLVYGAGDDKVYGTDDDDNYYIYVLSMGDLGSYDRYSAGFNSNARAGAGFTETVAKAIENFNTDAAKLKKNRPLFIVSHLPLFNRRNDNAFAEQWFDAINKVAEGMDVAFFFGHNHNYDVEGDYYYAKGSMMPVATADRWTSYETGQGNGGKPSVTLSSESKQLNFTHLCAGYMSPGTKGNTTRVGTVMAITIYDDSINYATYNSSGKFTGTYAVDATVNRAFANASGSTDSGNSGETTDPDQSGNPGNSGGSNEQPSGTVQTVEHADTKTTLSALGVTSVAVTKSSVNPNPEVYKAYAKYDITPEGYTDGTEATVSIELDNSFSANGQVIVFDVENGTSSIHDVVNHVVTFTTNHFSEYDVAEVDEAAALSATTSIITGVNANPVTSIDANGGYYLIGNLRRSSLLTGESATSEHGTGLKLDGGISNLTVDSIKNNLWYLQPTDSGYSIQLESAKGNYLSIGNRTARLDATKTVLNVSYNNNNQYWNIHQNGYYLNNLNWGDIAAGWNGNGASTDNGSLWSIYEVIETPVTLSVVPPSINLEGIGTTFNLANGVSVTVGNEAATSTAISYKSNDTSIVAVSSTTGELTAKGIGSTTVQVRLTSVNGSGLTSEIYVDVPVNVEVTPGAALDSFEGTVFCGSSPSTATGSKWIITREDGTIERIDVTLSMLSDLNNALNVNTVGVYPGLTVTFEDYTIENYTLRVIDESDVLISPDAWQLIAPATDALYVAITGPLTYDVSSGTTAEAAIAAVKAGISVWTSSKNDGTAEMTNVSDEAEGLEWILDPSYNGNVPGTYDVTIRYTVQNVSVVLGTAKVVVPEKQVSTVEISNKEGTISAGGSTVNDVVLYVTYEDGSTANIPVTVDMITGDFDVNTKDTYEDLTITYKGIEVTDEFILHVVEKAVNNYPEYPEPGAVKVNKTGTGIDFQASGIAQIELSASGIPIEKGVDLVIMLDTSSSMQNNNVADTDESRAAVLEESLADLIAQLKTPGDDGELLDIKVAIADFNGYFGDGSGDDGTSGTAYDRTSGDYVKDNDNDNGSGYAQASGARVYTGSNALNAGAFISVENLANTYTLNYTSGTNYDYAFDAIYQLGTAIKAQNAVNQEERDLYVIFMSDGAALQWNYFGTQNGYTRWNSWLSGTWTAEDLTTSNLNSTAHSYFYDLNDHDGDGHINEHRMANAIKGDPDKQYEIIRKSMAGLPEGTLKEVTGKEYMYTVPGLGATMFTINFDSKQDGQIEVANIDKSLSSTASDQTGTTKYYHKVTTSEELHDAFNVIGAEIAYAASNARFVDKIGDDFNLQMKPSSYIVVNEDGQTTTSKTLKPQIEIISYDIYTKADAEAGVIPAGKQVGDRKGTYKILETVTFSDDGKKAYSDQIDGGKTNILADGTQEGYVKGVIYAKTFVFNTNVADVAVEGVRIPTGVGTETTNVLPSETFYWKMGTVQLTELAMRYYVYLDGSMEGTKPAGSYPTNEYAILYYDNYLGNPCEKPTVPPMMAWKEANVSYAFYLVDANGNPIVNQTTGEIGTFANRIAITNPVVYKGIMLNNDEAVQSINMKDISREVVPPYYTLYDSGAEYKITIYSNSTGAWVIKKGDNSLRNSTYVTNYNQDPSAYSNSLTNSRVGNDYTHTIVWFAVLWNIQAIPDTVVIDYGLPVDISVLSNDMFGEKGQLSAVRADTSALPQRHTSALESGFSSSCVGTYGTATANISTGKVRYTPSSMEMNGYDKFAYAVNYTGDENAGYYYETVTVIPATTIYYEDDFLEYTKLEWTPKPGGQIWEGEWIESNNQIWERIGTMDPNTVQDEDRPGRYSIADANNIYGYDSAYTNTSIYSLNSVMKATVDYDNAAQASFEFYGTGFDVISMTDSTTGTIFVYVYQVNDDGTLGKQLKSLVVDTYYGYDYGPYYVNYTYSNGEWSKDVGEKAAEGSAVATVVLPENPSEGQTVSGIENTWVLEPNEAEHIYQVPVMKVEGLDYGHYKAVIKAVYEPAFDHVKGSANGNYDFYLDAIRIYDPANDGMIGNGNDKTIEEAYKADSEGWPSYIELRNKLIEANSFDDLANNQLPEEMKMSGLVFIDGNASIDDARITDYMNYGPNNEVYVAKGQRVAFILNTPDNIEKVHIGIKSADGKPAAYTITNIANRDSDSGKVKAGNYYNPKTHFINTSTDMYYDLTGWKNDIIVISNTGDRYGTEGIISLTNIKSTYKSNPVAANGVMTTSTEDELFESNETYLYVTPKAAFMALKTMDIVEGETPDTMIPESPESDVVNPEKPKQEIDKDVKPETETTTFEKSETVTQDFPKTDAGVNGSGTKVSGTSLNEKADRKDSQIEADTEEFVESDIHEENNSDTKNFEEVEEIEEVEESESFIIRLIKIIINAIKKLFEKLFGWEGGK